MPKYAQRYCPKCGSNSFRLFYKNAQTRCNNCQFTGSLQIWLAEKPALKPKLPKYHGIPAGKIVIGRGSVWGSGPA